MRIHLLTTFNLLLLFFTITIYGQSPIQANETRVKERMLHLGRIGDESAGILKRVAWSKGDLAARQYITSLMQDAGLTVRIDAAGNIIGSRKGKRTDLPPLCLGSHTDAVPNGGIYDGDLGVMGALECIELLNDNQITTEHPLEVIDFVDEEGGLTGSWAMAGDFPAERLKAMTNSGKTIGEGMRYLGGNPDSLLLAARPKGSIAGYLELHIEQGANLEKAQKNIGIVEGIVGLLGMNIVVTGLTNHAGTTPMPIRKDALVTAAKLIILINETVLSIPGRQVATVGQIKAFPGATNVIPGKVVMSLDLRDLSLTRRDSVLAIIRQRADSLAAATGTHIEFVPDHSTAPALTDRRYQELIAQSAKELGLSTLTLPSGAGHDAQEMARIAPMGMIFVPSHNGISHNPEEYTSPKDMANGASVLFRTLLKLDTALLRN